MPWTQYTIQFLLIYLIHCLDLHPYEHIISLLLIICCHFNVSYKDCVWQILYAAKNALHRSKFGEDMPWSYGDTDPTFPVWLKMEEFSNMYNNDTTSNTAVFTILPSKEI
jgi:hypothetical protein